MSGILDNLESKLNQCTDQDKKLLVEIGCLLAMSYYKKITLDNDDTKKTVKKLLINLFKLVK